MPRLTTPDGVGLHVECTGAGTPLLFVHEFAGDHRSWAPQVACFSDRYRCVVYAARGYPPSEVPADPAAYSQAQAVADAIAVLDGLGIDRAHVVGLSMGGFCALHLALRHPERVRSIVVAGCGYGAHPDARERFRAECEAIAVAFETTGSAAVAETYAVGPARVQLQAANPRAWREFADQLAEHSALGAALTMRGVQRERPSLYELADELAAVAVPTLIMAGDEDDGCIEASVFLKRTMPTSGLTILPRSGHTLNLERPDVFNRAVAEFLDAVAAGTWGTRDPRARPGSITGAAVGDDA